MKTKSEKKDAVENGGFKLDLHKVLRDNQAQIVKTSVESIQKSLIETLDWQARDKINGMLSEFLEKEVMPEVLEKLREQKGEFVQAIYGGIANVGEEIAKKMAEKATENLSSSWNLKKMVESLFN